MLDYGENSGNCGQGTLGNKTRKINKMPFKVLDAP